MNIAVIGRGNVGLHLERGLRGRHQVHVLGRDEPLPTATDLVLVAVPDAQVLDICDALPADLWVAHTAGAVEQPKGACRGVFYPLYSFSRDQELEWTKVPLLLEATAPEGLELLRKVGLELTEHVFELSSEQRSHLHAAAVMVNNFTNYLYTLAFEHLGQGNIPSELLFPIMRQGPEKAISMGPEAAQTGPARRGDWATIEQHVQRLQGEDAKRAYQVLSALIAKHYE